MALRIEKNIPIWEPANRIQKGPMGILVDSMEFGDSVMITDEKLKSNVASAIVVRQHKAVTRQIIENNEVIGWRVWKMPKVVGV